MKTTAFLILCFSALSSRAQKTVDVSSGDVNVMSPLFFRVVAGEPFSSVKFAKLIEGTPYFAPDWMKGSVTVDGGNQYTGLYIKLDLFDNEVHYRNEKGTELVAITPIQKVSLEDTTTKLVYNFVNGSLIDSKNHLPAWYQQLTTGKFKLLKKIDKQMEENRPYGSATVEQSMITRQKYYVLVDQTLTEVKKIKELPELMGDKKDLVGQFIRTKNISGKSDEDFEAVVNYANSLN